MAYDADNVVPDVTTDYRPNPSEVARLLRARTQDKNGVEVGDWNDDTRPTPSEVDDLIDQALGDVLAQIGPLHATPVATPTGEAPPVAAFTLDDLVIPAARTLVTLRAAMFVELSYFPEQVNSGRSAYVEYKRLYDDGIAALTGDGSGDGGGALPGAHGAHATWDTPSAYVVGAYRSSWLWTFGDLPGDHWPEPENPANWPDPLNPPVGDEPASGTDYPNPDPTLWAPRSPSPAPTR